MCSKDVDRMAHSVMIRLLLPNSVGHQLYLGSLQHVIILTVKEIVVIHDLFYLKRPQC